MGMTVNSIANNKMSMDLIKLSTAKKINSASDDAAGMAIAEKLESEINGLGQGTRNTEDMSNLIKTAEGGLSSIDDNLQRIRELSVQASNGTLTDADRGIIQDEVNQLLEGISSTVQGTQYNNKNLLDGTFTNQNTASSADGTGAQVSIQSMSLDKLGLNGFDVTKGIDISKIDSAISAVNGSRAELGAMSNRLEHTISSNDITMLNMAAAKSRIVDTDMAKSATDYNKDRITNEYQMMAQKRQQDSMTVQKNMLM